MVINNNAKKFLFWGFEETCILTIRLRDFFDHQELER